ncbi:MAG: hypothetical protein IPJ58_13160 [Ardenticatenia bacterium]|nr:hypothetical protein [Ardenticatenia bacterium]
MYIRTAGWNAPALGLWFKAQDDCLRARICDVATVAPGRPTSSTPRTAWDRTGKGAAWIQAPEWMGVAVDICGRDILMAYIGEPVPFAYAFDDGTG